MMQVKQMAEQIKEDIIGWRRSFHQNPELAWGEINSGLLIANELTKLGIEVKRIAGVGVLGILKGDQPGQTVALRSDMDALPVTEATDAAYKSTNIGVMHACGHDGHMAMLLGAAKILSQMKSEIMGTVRFIFQPAEEIGEGALKILDEGIMEGVHAILSIHLWPDLTTGKVSLDPGPRMASGDKLKITVRGKSGHGSMPHQGIDAITVAGAILSNLQSINSREVNPLEPVVVTIGKFHGGSRWNVICDEVVMEGTTRAFNPEVRNKLEAMIARIVKNTAATFRAEAELEYTYITPATINDPVISQIARKALTKIYGDEILIEAPKVMPGEDFAHLCGVAPGVIAFLGTGNKEKETTYPLHHEKFNIDEDALVIGTSLHAQFALNFLAGQKQVPGPAD